MKKLFSFLMFIAITNIGFSQKTINNPTYNTSSIPGNIRKIEITEIETILHFELRMGVGTKFFIPKESYIQDNNSEEKLFVTKADGVPIAKWNTVTNPKVSYTLYFPKIDKNTKKIDFGEANGGGWNVFKIELSEEANTLLIPNGLIGNWLRTDGSNQYDCSFYKNKAIFNKQLWKYKSVKQKGKTYTILLENDKTTATLYAKIKKNGIVKIGSSKRKLISYNTKRTHNPKYKLKGDAKLNIPNFKQDTAVYSGIVKNYSKRLNKSTGVVHVDNIFTGNQESYVYKIKDNGSFSIKIPICYAHQTYIRSGFFNGTAYLSPRKETFHVIDGNNSLFMGDCAQINTDLERMESISYFDYQNATKDILNRDPKEYKKMCYDVQKRELDSLNKLISKEFISKKALELKKLNILFSSYEHILSYDMYANSAQYQNKKKGIKNSPLKYKIPSDYLDFITPDILNDKKAIVSTHYDTFINRLMFFSTLNNNTSISYSQIDLLQLIYDQGVQISKEEKKILHEFEKVNTSEYQKIQKEFNDTYQKSILEIYQRDINTFQKFMNDSLAKDKSIAAYTNFLSEKGVVFSKEDKKTIKASEEYSQKEEIKKATEFYTKNSDILNAINKKYTSEKSVALSNDRHLKNIEKAATVFGIKKCFAFDIMLLQNNARNIERNFTPYSDTLINFVENLLENKVLIKNLKVENDKVIAEIEANKSKSGFNINSVEKNEGDELFEALIKKFKGKVIYVDFWATWCAPCRSGIKKIAPLKEELKNEDLVFLYITNPTSPEKTWKNSIPNIKGEHYRISQDEWNYLQQKFGINGIPHYTLVDKEGNVVRKKLGHMANKGIKKMLLDLANKN